MLTLLIVLASALLTALVGIPVAVRLSRPHLWGTRQLATQQRSTEQLQLQSFEPMDLGPDLMQWPSETPWKVAGIPEPPWPSQTWDDPHFGLQARAGNVAGKPSSAVHTPTVAPSTPHLSGGGPQPEPSGPSHRAVQRRARQEMSGLRNRALELKEEARSRSQQAVAQKMMQVRQEMEQRLQHTQASVGRPDAADVARVSGASVTDVPKPAEIERLVEAHGLAGAVQVVMKRTGWDFRTAAQYLAKVRGNR